MSATGYQLTGSTVTAVADRRLFEYLTAREAGIISGCAVTYSGATISVANGYGFGKGCFFSIAAETLTPTLPSSGTYVGRVTLNIDADNNTCALATQTGSTLPALQQDDINNGGSLYQVLLATFTCNTSAVTDLEQTNIAENNVAESLFPVGSIATTSSNSAPSFGTWTLVGKKFAEQTITSGILSSFDAKVSGSSANVYLSGDCLRIDFNLVATGTVSSSVTGGEITLANIGVDALPNFHLRTWLNATFNSSDWYYVPERASYKFYTRSIGATGTYKGSVTLLIPAANKLDSFCDQFIWKRTA